MELEEAINNLKKLVELRKNKRGEIKFDTCICGTKDLEIVLQALEDIQKNYELAIKQNISYKQNIHDLKYNSILKKKIEDRINELDLEIDEEYEKSMAYHQLLYARCELKELLEDK